MVVMKNELDSIIEILEIMGDEKLMEGIKRSEKTLSKRDSRNAKTRKKCINF